MMYKKGLHWYSVFVAASTFLLIIAGGLVTSTQSGLSVPDWPNTYGHFMFAFPLDQMVGGIFYEHSHRMIASTVGFLTIILAFWLWKKDERPWMRKLGFFALAAVITQGILGGLTVLFFLPTAISVSHATLAQTFFMTVTGIALFTSRWWMNNPAAISPTAHNTTLSKLAFLTTGAIYIQLILGALMRHMHAGLAVPDFPLAYGQLFPSISPEQIAAYNQQLLQSDLRIAADGEITKAQIVVHMLHRGWALVVSGTVLWSAIRLLRAKLPARIKKLGIAMASLLVIQVTLGVLTILSQKAIDVTTAHVATGALLLAVSFLTSLHIYKIYGMSLRSPGISIRPQEVTA